MSLQGATKFTNTEISKFQPIADALRANQTDSAKALIAKLDDAEKLKVKQFIIEDKQKFLKEKKEREERRIQLESQAVEGEKKVAKLEAQIADLDISKTKIFSQGSQQAVSDMKSRPLNGQSTTTSNTRIVNKI